jgi:uncharacterized membrane protein
VSAGLLRAALTALCVAGAAVSAYVLSSRWSDAALICSTGGCETVQSSPYAELLGLPVAALGLGGFLLIGALAQIGRPVAVAVAGAAALALAAVVFSGYLLVIQLAVIGAVCDWCLASDAITSLVAIVALLRLRGTVVAEGRRTVSTA